MIEQFPIVEAREKPKFCFMITRHAERLPAGELSEEGKELARNKGQELSKNKVLKGYASDHKSRRAYDTAELITQESGTSSPNTGKPYKTRMVEGIQYGILEPEFKHLLVRAKDMIDTATLQDAGYSTECDEEGKLKVDIDKLSIEEQTKLAPLRTEKQRLGLDLLMENRDAVHRMAVGLAHQLVKELKITKKYDELRTHKDKPLKDGVIINTVTHGAFMESLLMEAGVQKDSKGQKKEGAVNIKSEEFGGYIQPGESIYFDVADVDNLPDYIPVYFENQSRPNDVLFIDKRKLMKLALEYSEREKNKQ